MTFAPFFFDGNSWHGRVDGPEKLAELLRWYDVEDILRAKIAPVSEIAELPADYHLGAMGVRTGAMPSFGWRSEHTGTVTLVEWARNRGIDLRAMAEKIPR